MLRLRELREEKGLTQSELANRLGIATSSIGMYEQGRRVPSPRLLIKMAQLFDANVEYILGNSDVRARVSNRHTRSVHTEVLPDDYFATELFDKLCEDEEGRNIIKAMLKRKIAEIALPKVDMETANSLTTMIASMEDGEVKSTKLKIIRDIIEIDFTLEHLIGLSSFIKSFKKPQVK